jgi:hypothetical protein
MRRLGIESVQLFNFTDGCIPEDILIPTKTPRTSCQTNRGDRFSNPARFFNRTLHSLWKTRLQVRGNCRAWSQIFFIGQLSWPQTRAGLCTAKVPETGEPVCSQLPEGKTNLRGDLQHQSGTLTTERKVVTLYNEYSRCSLDSHRYHWVGNL